MNENLGFYNFKIIDVPLTVYCHNQNLIRTVNKWLSAFATTTKETSEHAIYISLVSSGDNKPIVNKLPSEAVLFYESNSVTYYTYRNVWIIEYEKFGRIYLNKDKDRMLCIVKEIDILESEWNFEEYMHPLSEILRRYEIYQYHSGSVTYNDRGILLAGKSGSGKTTLALDLLDNGFFFLSDDRCFLTEVEEGIEIIAFCEAARIYPSNAVHTKMNGYLKNYENSGKVMIKFENFYPGMTKTKCKLDLIVFPFWSPETKSSIERVSQGFVLKELLPLTMICFEPITSQKHFEFNCRLAENIPSIRLILGNDRENWNKLIREYITEIGA